MKEQIKLLCKKLKAHSVSLVYTPCNNNITNPHVHAVWQPWQIITRYNNDTRTFFRFSKTLQEAINSAMEEIEGNQLLDSVTKGNNKLT